MGKDAPHVAGRDVVGDQPLGGNNNKPALLPNGFGPPGTFVDDVQLGSHSESIIFILGLKCISLLTSAGCECALLSEISKNNSRKRALKRLLNCLYHQISD